MLPEVKNIYNDYINEPIFDNLEGYSEVVPGKLGFTDERIDELLSGGWYGSTNKDYAQAYIAYISPMFEIVTLYIRASNIINKITIFNAKS